MCARNSRRRSVLRWADFSKRPKASGKALRKCRLFEQLEPRTTISDILLGIGSSAAALEYLGPAEGEPAVCIAAEEWDPTLTKPKKSSSSPLDDLLGDFLVAAEDKGLLLNADAVDASLAVAAPPAGVDKIDSAGGDLAGLSPRAHGEIEPLRVADLTPTIEELALLSGSGGSGG